MRRNAIIMATWKRPRLTEIVVDYYQKMCKKHNFEFITDNSDGPISNKYNSMVLKTKDLDVRGIIIVGSDDFLNDNMFRYYNSMWGNEKNYYGSRNCYFYSVPQNESIYTTRKDQSIGPGRYFSRYILELADWKLWDSDLAKNIDANCQALLKSKGIKEKFFTLKSIGGFMVDIKHEDNLTDFNAIKQISKVVSNEIVKRNLGIKLYNRIRRLNG